MPAGSSNHQIARLMQRPSQAGRVLARLVEVDGTSYGSDRAAELLNAATPHVNQKIADLGLHGAVPADPSLPQMLQEVDKLFVFRSLEHLGGYLAAGAPPPLSRSVALPKLAVAFDEEHGGLHMSGKVSANKSQWTESKVQACARMEAEIAKHLATLVRQSRPKGWEPWYIGADAGKPIGKTVNGPESRFTLQVQVNVGTGEISYHGYPDQRLLKTGVAKSKSKLGQADVESAEPPRLTFDMIQAAARDDGPVAASSRAAAADPESKHAQP